MPNSSSNINGDPTACYQFENNWWKLGINLVLLCFSFSLRWI